MIRVDIDEVFPITVSLVDDATGQLVPGQTVYYDIRDMSDNTLATPLNGIVPESTVEPGIYRTSMGIDTSGAYVCYATCSGFLTKTEEIIVNPESIYDLAKQNRHYNISVEDVPRTTVVSTASQANRNVPYNRTDYVVTVVKSDDDSDWTGTVASGITYAWYRSVDDNLPYKMGSEV